MAKFVKIAVEGQRAVDQGFSKSVGDFNVKDRDHKVLAALISGFFERLAGALGHERFSDRRQLTDILTEALHTALGGDVMRLLALPDLTDLFLNDDGRLWTNRTGIGRKDTGHVMSFEMAYSALCLIAGGCGKVITKETPTLSAIIPGSGERIEGSIPPKSSRATFSIRKPPGSVFPLEAFDPDGRFIPTIKEVVGARKNILLAGGTGSGKTSLLSSVLALPAVVNSRCIIIEDEREIMTSAPDHKRFLVSKNEPLRALVKSALRSNPERIVLGEVRDGQAANEMLTALATGHPGSSSRPSTRTTRKTRCTTWRTCWAASLRSPTAALRGRSGASSTCSRTKTRVAARSQM